MAHLPAGLHSQNTRRWGLSSARLAVAIKKHYPLIAMRIKILSVRSRTWILSLAITCNRTTRPCYGAFSRRPILTIRTVLGPIPRAACDSNSETLPINCNAHRHIICAQPQTLGLAITCNRTARCAMAHLPAGLCGTTRTGCSSGVRELVCSSTCAIGFIYGPVFQ